MSLSEQKTEGTTSPRAPETDERNGAGDEDGQENAPGTDTEEREAYEYWGYLFKPDKTGTDKLKSLLRGLKDLINQKYESSDQPDLTPNQLAHFYRDLHGNYDQLFLGTPHESISFIYKSLGCLHSLQPPAYTHATAFTDPTVPALKTEGWIMWQTIQLLLGPDEHSSFIREAVKMWDVKDHDTGEVFPKILPRECFPMEPDKHMVAWYEGVSERLRKEADDEERQKRLEAERTEPQKRLHATERPTSRRNGDAPPDDDGSVDSRAPALAYFRNPLYRYVDGRSSVMRNSSKRPGLSPRPTMMDKGKEAASSFGRIARNVGSPHLWDGRGTSRSRDGNNRRKSHPDNHYYHGNNLPPPDADDRQMQRVPSSHSHRRRTSSQLNGPERPSSARQRSEDNYGADGPSSTLGQEARPSSGSEMGRNRQDDNQSESRDQQSRQSRSHDPTPSQEGEGDYFAGYDAQAQRQNSAQGQQEEQDTGPSIGPSFGPSASPLFAAHVAKQPRTSQARSQQSGPPQRDSYDGGAPLRNPSIRRAQGRYPDRNPDRESESGNRRSEPAEQHRPDSRHRRHDDHGRNSPAPYDNDRPGSGGPPMGGRHRDSHPPPPRDRRESRDHNRDSRDARRSSGRVSGSDLDRHNSEEDDNRRSRPKQTRFAESGVKGRRYPDDSPYDDRRRQS